MRSIARCLVQAPRLLFVATSLASASSAHAQGDIKSAVVSFASGSASSNGYLHAQVRIRYRFSSCSYAPTLSYALEPNSVQGFEGYWYEGKFYGLNSTWRPPAGPALEAPFQVSFNARPIPVNDLRNPVSAPTLECTSSAHTRTLGKWTDFTTPTLPQEEAVKHFTLDVGTTRAPMRSPDIEATIRAEIAAATHKARADSVERARVARVEQARRDSVARAQQQRTAASSPVPTTGAATAADVGTRPRETNPQTDAERQAAARAEEQRQADDRARMVMENIKAQQAEQAARTQQVDAAAAQIGGMVGSILEQRRIDEERRNAREVATLEAFQRYATQMEKVFAALPVRPACTATEPSTQVVSIGTVGSGVMLGSECRLPDRTSAQFLRLRMAKRQKVEITATTGGAFYPVVMVRPLGVASAIFGDTSEFRFGGATVEGFLPAGDYELVVATRLPGETGAYSVAVEKGLLSRTTLGSIGLFMGPINAPLTGVSEEQDVGNVGGLRATIPINQWIHIAGEAMTNDGTAEFYQADLGLRVLPGSRTSKIRPILQYTYGWRRIFADAGFTGDYYSGTGSTFSAGAEYFLTPGLGLELTIAKVMGTLNIGEDNNGGSPTVDFAHTAIRIGMMLHK